MKRTPLIDVLPTLFGVVAIAGLLLSPINAGSTIGLIMLYGCGTTALITALVSIISAVVKHARFNKVHYVNVLWIVLPGLFFAWGLYVSLNFRIHPGSITGSSMDISRPYVEANMSNRRS